MSTTHALANTGVVEAKGGALTIDGAVTGSGKAEIAGGGTIAFGASAGKIKENIVFTDTGAGNSILKFDEAARKTANSSMTA